MADNSLVKYQTYKKILSAISQRAFLQIVETNRSQALIYEKNGMPRNKDKTYNLFHAIPWLKQHWRDTGRHGENKTDGNSDDDKRWKKYRADVWEVKRDRLRVKLVDRQQVIDEWKQLCAEAAAKFRALIPLSRRLAGIHDALEIENLLQERINLILEDLSRGENAGVDGIGNAGIEDGESDSDSDTTVDVDESRADAAPTQ
jgi:hypothetical protein